MKWLPFNRRRTRPSGRGITRPAPPPGASVRCHLPTVVELHFRDGSSAVLDPRSEVAIAIETLAYRMRNLG
jgi:hypothetical protein